MSSGDEDEGLVNGFDGGESGGESGGEEPVEEDGPLSKMCGSLGAMCLGLVIFPLALILLGWNENHYVCENRRIIYAEEKADDVGCDSSKVTNQFAFFSCNLLESSLPHFQPCRFNDGKMQDCDSMIHFSSASGMQRVEMYQCVESCTEKKTKNSLGQNVKKLSCTYKMRWDQAPIESASFRDAQAAARACPGFAQANGNPTFPSNLEPGETTNFAQTVQTAPSPGYTLNHDLVQKLPPDTPVSLAPFAANFSTPKPPPAEPWARPLAVSRANLRLSSDRATLETCAPPYHLGCVRIRYFKSAAKSPAVITQVSSAGQTGKARLPGSWGCSASTWQAIRPKALAKEELVKVLSEENKTTVWLIRICGALFAVVAVCCCLQPISAAADVAGDALNWLPCGGMLESCVEGLVDWVICLISCNVGLGASFLVIATVWVFMRPMWGIGLLVLGCCCCGSSVAVRQMFKQDKGNEDKAQQPLE